VSGLVRPDADVVGFLPQLDAVPHAEPLGHLARGLEPAGPVQHRVLAGVHGGLAGVVAVITGSYLGTVRLAAGTGSNW
jgi:hypothetical protein